MAQKVTVEMTDDLDGSTADVTVAFAVDGTAYEIDLSKRNAAAMRRAFGRYIEHARKAGRSKRAARRGRDRHSSAAVREWAKAQGLKVSERGRIPADVVVEYEKAQA
jgi:nucleoid-associated protein Lsr2